ncbi:MAG: hypothetical protein JXR76_24455, partial [Deltaproteobacteria bacterium]|nr:hypothetical protein [Deltaproteobacteria bacterium]
MYTKICFADAGCVVAAYGKRGTAKVPLQEIRTVELMSDVEATAHPFQVEQLDVSIDNIKIFFSSTNATTALCALYYCQASRGRLQGDYRTYGYTMADRGAELLFRILRVSLREHAFHADRLLNKRIALSFSRQI